VETADVRDLQQFQVPAERRAGLEAPNGDLIQITLTDCPVRRQIRRHNGLVSWSPRSAVGSRSNTRDRDRPVPRTQCFRKAHRGSHAGYRWIPGPSAAAPPVGPHPQRGSHAADPHAAAAGPFEAAPNAGRDRLAAADPGVLTAEAEARNNSDPHRAKATAARCRSS
jgi:hypothetical protein